MTLYNSLKDKVTIVLFTQGNSSGDPCLGGNLLHASFSEIPVTSFTERVRTIKSNTENAVVSNTDIQIGNSNCD